MAASQAMNVQNFLDYTREHEQGDRIGIDILYKSGYNVGSAIDFFNTSQKGNRYSSTAPSYLRTHPITSDRISDISDRLKDYPTDTPITVTIFILFVEKLELYTRIITM